MAMMTFLLQSRRQCNLLGHQNKTVGSISDNFLEDQDQHVPMYFETLETISDQRDHHMEEVEMEDLYEESVVDIYVSDDGSQLPVVEYVEDLYAHYRRMEIIVKKHGWRFKKRPSLYCRHTSWRILSQQMPSQTTMMWKSETLL